MLCKRLPKAGAIRSGKLLVPMIRKPSKSLLISVRNMDFIWLEAELSFGFLCLQKYNLSYIIIQQLNLIAILYPNIESISSKEMTEGEHFLALAKRVAMNLGVFP